jgi:TonB-linked SusC/RagA family outer membrane protein
MKTFKTTIFLILIAISALGQAEMTVKGKVYSTLDSVPVNGATLKIKESPKSRYITDETGNFTFKTSYKSFKIIVSHLGFTTTEIEVSASQNEPLQIFLKSHNSLLKEVRVSTGFQNISKERSTGSFSHINKDLFNRQVSTDVVSRLDGVVNAVQFDRRDINSKPKIIIRGLSTIFSNASPLIILNNFPYEGDISNINPNDVENVTILKDAAAASIWGVKAGNGVIVINTKKGITNQPIRTSYSSNFTLGFKPDMRKLPIISSSDFIDVEKMLFAKRFYDAKEGDSVSPISPVLEALYKSEKGQLNPNEANDLINSYRNHDLRNDLNKYLYQNGKNQQYALSLSGGGTFGSYYFSAGLDDNVSNLKAGYKRFSLRSDNTLNISKRLSLGIAIGYSQINEKGGNPAFINFNTLYPYARFADENGSALAVNKYYRGSFIQKSQKGGLLNWDYKPLEELSFINQHNNQHDLLLNTDLNYAFNDDLKIGLKYQYNTSVSKYENLQNIQSYYVRDLVNNFSQFDEGKVFRPIPDYDILDYSNSSLSNHSVRAQINYLKLWGKHELTALAGTELRETRTLGNVSRIYGYDPNIITSKPVDYETSFEQYNPDNGTSRIPYLTALSDLNNRFVSFFVNSAYIYNDKYTISGSIRKDGSNLFGVKSNQRIVPLWSLGAGWNISNEEFYKSDWVPYLKIRATFGYSGNINQNVSAYPIMYLNNGNLNNESYGVLRNPPNTRLMWEKAAMYNFGLDFKTQGNVISGSIEYYKKKNTDLIGYMPIDQTTGALAPATLTFSYLGNSASMEGQGVDIDIHTLNINRGFKWNTDLLFSYAATKVTSYMSQSNDLSNYITGGQVVSPIVGKPVYSIFAYKWAGLDPENGDPMGYLHGQVSKDYALITSQTTPNELVYKGSAIPTKFGALRNTFTWKGFSLSANISYKFGYYFRRNGVSYQALLNGMATHSDYSLRWQNPGDEKRTNVPSFVYPLNPNRDSKFYPRTESLISKGDNIRLQDISFSYKLSDIKTKMFLIKNLTIYCYTTNLGIIWKADNHPIDPDYGIMTPPTTLSFGVRAEF